VLEPDEANATSLAAALERNGITGRRVLIPGGDLARAELRQGLDRAGAAVTQVVAYRTVMPERYDGSIIDSLCHGQIDVVAVASPSAIRNLAAMLGRDTWCLRRVRIACIGATTAEEVTRLGCRPFAAAGTGTEALQAAIVAAYRDGGHA
jgi:uroporphyrinogen-III synthase